MTGGHGMAALSVAHLLYTSPDARLQIVTHELGALGDETTVPAWFFVDLPLGTGADARQGLEIAVWGRFREAAIGPLLSDGMRRWLAAGLVAAAREVGASLVLQPALFPGEVLPPCYPDALAAGSRRARVILTEVAAAGCVRASAATVRAELAATYRMLVPDPPRRRTALTWHADWLEAVAQETGKGGRDAVNGNEAGEIPVPAAWPVEYAPLRRRLATHVARLIARGNIAPEKVRDAAYAALVARLAHIQTLRLWGPPRGDELRREAAVVRELAAPLS
jgi:hypothetical protein